MKITSMNVDIIEAAALQFGHGKPLVSSLGNGLIHHTYKVAFTGEGNSSPIVLQNINRHMFKHPENIIYNYRLVYDVIGTGNGLHIAPLIPTHDGKWYWVDEQQLFWRATGFIADSYTQTIPNTAAEVYKTAQCFGHFTRSLNSIDTTKLKVIIPHFHDLALRYAQFEQAVSEAAISRLLKSTHVIAELRQRRKLVDFYEFIQQHPADYHTRVMHHDCKLSNILLDTTTHQALCPVDLDTIMPGLFFSDVGDMIRSMSATQDENSTQWEDIAINADFYKAIIAGYLEGIGDNFTPAEKKHIHQAGLMMVYMQSLRFVTDFLNNDVYYKIDYPEQNLNRALNQLILLEKLEEFVAEL
ncbi:phosphotransferase enzyme family protein [Paraflavitalea soli]|uniref:phosphotransferase enzyme family protein n=1 Tax=Paraflavitalea soli TaxID=2315862 RepID=UPI0013C52228|nr:phosphotransferase [Paraflavitalea soli]